MGGAEQRGAYLYLRAFICLVSSWLELMWTFAQFFLAFGAFPRGGWRWSWRKPGNKAGINNAYRAIGFDLYSALGGGGRRTCKLVASASAPPMDSSGRNNVLFQRYITRAAPQRTTALRSKQYHGNAAC